MGVVAIAVIVGIGAANTRTDTSKAGSAAENVSGGQSSAKSAAQIQDDAQEAAGWTVIESGSLYGKFASKDEYTCDYLKCSYYYVLTMEGCPTALYVEGSTLASGTVVGMTNDMLTGVRAGETAAANLTILEDGADSVRISSVECY